MNDLIDEEINLAPTRTGGSAKRIRAGRKRAMQAISMEQRLKTPLWKRQLSVYKKAKARAKK